ncbi:MAG: hypothetical protein AAFX65_07895 [Cyanobacteria bacterium J06638_7]
MLTPIGQLSIESVEVVTTGQISVDDAHRAGHGSKQELWRKLLRKAHGEIYRIQLGALAADPRIALREAPLATESEFHDPHARLTRLDRRSPDGAWTLRSLGVIEPSPAVRAGDLCSLLAQEKDRFKINVRKLKNLGFTESLGTGYRLSPRGQALIGFLHAAAQIDTTHHPRRG